MTTVSVADDTVVIAVHGWDKLWSLTSRLEIPLEHIIDVRRAADQVEGIRTLGTRVPGVITAGTFLQEDGLVFWDVHDPTKAIAFNLHDERYCKLVIEVPDPAETISTLQGALFRSRFQRG